MARSVAAMITVFAACVTQAPVFAVAAPTIDPARPWLSNQGPEGAAHFAEFDAACLATGGSLAAIKARAESQQWSAIEPKGKTEEGVTAHGWRYTTDDREYQVLVVESKWTFPNKPDLKDLPARLCSVVVPQSADTGALGAMEERFRSPGCGTGEIPGVYSTVEWRKRGAGYMLTYHFDRIVRDKDKPQDALTLKRVGADQTFASIDVSAVC